MKTKVCFEQLLFCKKWHKVTWMGETENKRNV